MPTTYGLPKKREQVLNMLQQAFIDQNLEEEDYEQRLSKTLQAKSVEELNEIVADFPQGSGAPFAQVHPPLSQSPVSKQITALMSTQNNQFTEKLSGSLRLSSFLGEQKVGFRQATIEGDTLGLELKAIMGSQQIDLRAEQFSGKHIQIQLFVVMGEVRIILPKGATLENQAACYLGEVSHSHQKIKRLIASFFSSTPIESKPVAVKVSLFGVCTLGSVVLVHD